MDAVTRIEQALDAALSRAEASGAARPARRGPPLRRLPGRRPHPAAPVPRGGARLRRRRAGAGRRGRGRRSSCCTAPRWSMTTCPASTTRPIRRGKPSVHRAFGEPLAVLAGDALIVLAFETLARGAGAPAAPPGGAGADRRPRRSACRSASSPARPGSASRRSICAPTTGPRPARCSPAATVAGAAAAGVEAEPWRDARRAAGRGLPGRRRHPRRGRRRRTSSASRSAATPPSTAERRPRARHRRRA